MTHSERYSLIHILAIYSMHMIIKIRFILILLQVVTQWEPKCLLKISIERRGKEGKWIIDGWDLL